MSFAEYLKERISEDYKNLIIQKLEEVKGQTEELRTRIAPAISDHQHSIQAAMRQELDRIQDQLKEELNSTEERISSQLNSMLEEHVASWYYSDISQFEQQLELLLSDILSNIPEPPKKKNEDLESVTELIGKLDQGRTQSEILNIVLQHISGWVDRAVLFVVKGEQAVGWAALGLGNEWDAARVRQMKVDLSKQNILHEVVQNGSAAAGMADQYPDNSELFMQIGSRFPRTALACPITVRGKIAGILYADLQEEMEQKPDISNLLYLASRAAGFAIDLLPLKPKTAAASVAAPARQATTPPPPVTVATQPVAVSSPGSMAVAAEPQVEEAEEVEEIQEQQPEPEPEPEPEATVMMPAVAPAPPAPAPVIVEEDQKLHDDAKRFARLLVSEIKLYNEAQVSAGREHKDLYERLRDDIERSRRMYLERVPNRIQTSTDYFYEELVRTLANGDPSLLGM